MKKILLLLVVFLNFGCKKFLTDFSQDLVIVKTTTDLDELLLGSAYLPSAEMSSIVSNSARNASPFLNFIADDVNPVVGTNPAFRGGWNPWINTYIYGYTTWQLDVGRNYDQTEGYPDNLTWDLLYNRINVVNMILAELENVGKNTEAEKNAAIRIEGEALFLRAQFYFLLANLYGDAYNPSNASAKLAVPLKLTEYVEHKGQNSVQFERATNEQVYNQIVLDLKKAVDCFQRSPQQKELYRASGPAAQLLLSRVYLYMQDWGNAYQAASTFLDKSNTLSNLNTHKADAVLITKDNREVIFSQGNLNLQNALSAYSDDFCVSYHLYDLYTEDDLRKTIYFDIHPQTDSVMLNNKYVRGTHRSYISDIFMLRNAEGYLNRAEAAAMMNNLDAASQALNRLRAFRIKDYTAQQFSADNIVDEIRTERRKELCFEGHRWFDLRRYAVNQIKPFQKDIVRYFSVYDSNTRELTQTEIYRLPAGDPAYTFSIPKSVVEFEPGTVNNPRAAREYESLLP